MCLQMYTLYAQMCLLCIHTVRVHACGALVLLPTPLQEIMGLGLANLAGSACNAYSTTGSFTRSAVNYDSGWSRKLLCCKIAAAAVSVLQLHAVTCNPHSHAPMV